MDLESFNQRQPADVFSFSFSRLFMIIVSDLLSSNLCSLRGGEERLAFSCVWEIDENANIIHTKFHKSVIKVSLHYGFQFFFKK